MGIAFKGNTLSLHKNWGTFTVGHIPDQSVVSMIVKGTIPACRFFSGTQLGAQIYLWLQWPEKYTRQKGAKILLDLYR